MRATDFSAVLAVAVCTSVVQVMTAGDKSPCLCLNKVVDRLYNPVEHITIRRDNSLLTLIVEQRGVVRAFVNNNEERAVFMNISDHITTSNAEGEERGLLSVALHPSYNKSRTGRVFVYYITTLPDKDYAYVSELQAIDDVVDVTSERRLLRLRQPNVKGNGGQLLFGDDGYLYIFTGDGTGHDDIHGHAQDPQSFLGKALRIDVDKQDFESGNSASGNLYRTPTSNPFYNDSRFRPEVFALGFRNPWRCSQDKNSSGGTGDIFCGDTGTDLFEEVNIVRKGRNYGWNLKEGNQCFNAINCSRIEKEEGPIYTYPHSSDWGSAVVGGFVYRGRSFPGLVGQFVYGDAVTGATYWLKEDKGGNWSSSEWPVCPTMQCPCGAREVKQPFLLAFGRDSNGEVMLLMTSEFSVLRPRGRLFRVFAPVEINNPATCGTCKLTSSPMSSLMIGFLVTILCVYTGDHGVH